MEEEFCIRVFRYGFALMGSGTSVRIESSLNPTGVFVYTPKLTKAEPLLLPTRFIILLLLLLLLLVVLAIVSVVSSGGK